MRSFVCDERSGWLPVEIFSRRAGDWMPGWALKNQIGSRVMVVYLLDGWLHRKHLRAGVPETSHRLRKRSFPFQPLEVPDSEEEDDFYGKTTIPDELELAMDLKMHLEILAPFVKMAKKTTMCNCQLGGTPATRIMSRLCGEVQDYLRQHVDGRSHRPQGIEENWCKILAVWHHFISEHLEYMIRQGLDGQIALDFLETSVAYGIGQEPKLKELIEAVRRTQV